MECTSRIELLVQELLDMVVELLHLADTSRLSRCSKRLAARLQHVLFSTEERCARAMRWGCEQGSNTVIHTAISYGAPISTLRPQLHLPDPEYSPYHTSTIQVAVTHQRFDTYQYLLGLGANLDIEYRYHHPAAGLLQQICRPKLQRTFLETFLRAGLPSQVPYHDSADWVLMAVLGPGVVCAEWPTVEVVRIILDWGANPDSGSESIHYIPWDERCKRFSGWKEPSALSSTVLMRRWDLFDLLLERGADIDGLQEPRRGSLDKLSPRVPFHIPILAAAHAMSAVLLDGDGQIDVEPLDRCLDAGATIKVSLLSDPKAILGVRDRAHPITPLLVYLDGVETWEPTSDDDGNDGNESRSCAGDRRDVAWGLQYLLDRGASLDGRDPAPTPSGSTAIRTKNDELWEKGRVFTFSPVVQLLLDRWSARHLLKAPFMKAVKVLIRHGDLEGQEGRVLARYEDDLPGLARGWQDLLTAVLATLDGQESLNRLLFEFITAKGEYPHLGALDGVEFPIGELARSTVLRLISAGADINAMVCCPELKGGPQTALFRLCDRYANRESHFFPLNMYRILPQRVAFLRWLVEVAGADPGIKCAYWTGDGRHALYAPAEVLRLEKWRINPGEVVLVEELIELFEGRVDSSE